LKNKFAKLEAPNLARIFLLLATALWGMSFPLVKALRSEFYCESGASEFTQSAAFVFVRFFATFVIFTVFAYLWKKPGKLSRREIYMGTSLGLMGGMGLLFQGDGMAYTDPATSAFLTQLSCILVPVVALLRRRRVPSKPFYLAMTLGLFGLYMLSGFDIRTFTLGRGEAETIVASIFFSLQILLIESRRWATLINVRSTCLMFFFFGAVNLPFFKLNQLCLGGMSGASTLALISFMSVLVVFCSLMSFGLMNMWQPKISGTEATFIYSLEAVFAVFFNFLWIPLLLMFGKFSLELQIPSLEFSIGALLLVLANIFLFAEAKRLSKKLF
jgi:drug/metabolite transporter (DMT)-like permease